MVRFALISLLVVGCVEAPSEESTSTDPVLGEGAHDLADRNCNIVLRNMGRNNTGLGFETQGPSWVWQGTIEISDAAAAEGLVPKVLYKIGSTTTWRQATATPVQVAATPGFHRYTVRISAGLPGPASSATTLANARIQVVPLLPTGGGGRLFDHNRNPGDLDNYVITSPDFAIWNDDAVCAPPAGPQRARLVFQADFTQHREGVLAPGGQVSIVYAQSRLDGCRATQGGNQLWDLTAHVKFDPGGQLLAASVRDAAATMSVPTDARRATVWFEATSAYGCHQWDSNFGNNYVFDAATPPQWVGNASSLMTRDTSGDVCGGAGASSGFSFDTWTRQRAAITNLCFEVYQPGMTDHDDPLLWQKLDTSIHWRGAGQTAWQIQPVDFDRRTGNNARFAQSWRELDPFRAYHCPEMPTTLSADQQYRSAVVEYYIVVNGYEVRPEPGAAFSGTFTDYANDPWRAANCH
ncbi:MAG: hypothetical protein JWO36_7047 [Myxococcales bacterium]|nr:hypothetical protein [Myxococcales bacterium]